MTGLRSGAPRSPDRSRSSATDVLGAATAFDHASEGGAGDRDGVGSQLAQQPALHPSTSRERALAHVAPAISQVQSLRASVERVRAALDEALALHLIDELDDRLLGHVQARRELGDRERASPQRPDHEAVSRAHDVARAGVRDYELIGDGPGGCDHENREVGVSNVVN